MKCYFGLDTLSLVNLLYVELHTTCRYFGAPFILLLQPSQQFASQIALEMNSNDWSQVSEIPTLQADRNVSPKKPPKQAACLNCRRTKTRCIRDPPNINCQRCRQNNTECLVPDYHVGRRKGIKK